MAFLETFGLVTLAYIAVQIGWFVYRLVSPTRIDVKKLGQWALVTGSTDGIGKAYAFELAKRGAREKFESKKKRDFAFFLAVRIEYYFDQSN